MKRGPVIATSIALLGAGAFAMDLQSVPIDDVDGDQRSDLVVASSSKGRQLMAVSSRGDHALWIFSPRENYAHGLPVVVTCADRDGDRARDLAVAWTSQAVDDIPEHVLVAIHSSRTGRVLASTRVPCTETELPLALVDAGDLDGDSRPELLLGLTGAFAEAGVVHVLSGADLAVREFARGGHDRERFGRALAGLGDVDDDGFDDVAVGSSGPDDTGVSISIVSGRTGETTRVLYGGWRFAAAREPGPHGSSNLWVVATAEGATDVVLMSPRTGEVLERVHIPDIDGWDMLYLHLSAAGDWDGDGYGDVLLRDEQWNHLAPGAAFVPDIGHVRIVGVRGELARWEGEHAFEHLGGAAAVSDDLDGDGRRDIWITAEASGPSEVRLYSGAASTLLRRVSPTHWTCEAAPR